MTDYESLDYFELTDADCKLPLGKDPNGRIIYAPPYRPIMTPLGAPRSGKTRQVAAPMAAAWPERALIVSARDDLLRLTVASRRRRGPVAVFDPAGALTDTDVVTESWDLLKVCAQWRGAVDFAFNLSNSVSMQSPLKEGNFWFALARKLLAPLLYAAATGGYTIRDAVSWVRQQEEFVPRSVLSAQGDSGRDALERIEAIWSMEDRARSSVYATADVVVQGLDNPTALAAVTGGIDLDEFLSEPGATLYVIAPATAQDQYAPIITSALGQVITGALARHHRTGGPARLLVLVDEAGNVGFIPGLAELCSIAAGCGIQLVTLWHNPGQIRAIYGTQADTVLANTEVMLFLPGRDREAAQLLDDRIGNDPDASLPEGSGISRLRRISPGNAICVAGNQDPFRLELLSPSADPDLRFELGG